MKTGGTGAEHKEEKHRRDRNLDSLDFIEFRAQSRTEPLDVEELEILDLQLTNWQQL